MTDHDLRTVMQNAVESMYAAAAAEPPEPAAGAWGEDPDGYARATIDGRGMLSEITYAPEVRELTAAQLAEVAQAAVQNAYAVLRGARPAPSMDIGDSEVDAAARRAFGWG